MIEVECKISALHPQTIVMHGWSFEENAFWDYSRYGCWVKGPCGEQHEFLPDTVGGEEKRILCGKQVSVKRSRRHLLHITIDE